MPEALEWERQFKKGQPCQFLSSFTRKTFDPQSYETVATALLRHQWKKSTATFTEMYEIQLTFHEHLPGAYTTMHSDQGLYDPPNLLLF